MPPVVEFKGDYEKLAQFVKKEYADALLSRRRYEQMLDEYDRQYEQVPRVAQKTFPWVDASNLEVPTGATHVDTVVSRIESAYFATQPWVLVRQLGPNWEEHCNALQDYMNLLSLPASHYREEKAVDLLQSAKLGTSFQFLTYEVRTKSVRDRNNRKISHIIHDGPLQQAIHPRNFIHPIDARNLRDARWLGIRSYKTWGEVISNMYQGIYSREFVNKIEGSGTFDSNEVRRDARQGFKKLGELKQWHIPSIACLYQDEGMDEPEDLWVDFHYPSGNIARAIYNPWDHMQWPFSKSVYMLREDAFLGIGIMNMLSMIQEEITTIHNYCLDNLLAANTVVVKGKTNSVRELNISPMGFIEVSGNPKDDLIFERLGTALSGQQVGEAAANAYAERRTGVSDANVNRQAPTSGLSSSRTPATTTMALLGESNKRFELAIDNNKRADSELLRQHAILLRQFWQRQKRIADRWDAKKSDLITKLFMLPLEDFTYSVTFEVAASTVTINKETERQNMMILGQFMKGFYELFIAYLTLMSQQPALEPVIRKILNGASIFVERLLRTFDIRDPESFIPRIDELRGAAAERPQGAIDQLSQAFLNGTFGGNEAGSVMG